jgi:hypothetical protein
MDSCDYFDWKLYYDFLLLRWLRWDYLVYGVEGFIAIADLG